MFACARHDTGSGSSRPGATSHTVPAQSLRLRPPHAALRLRESCQLPIVRRSSPCHHLASLSPSHHAIGAIVLARDILQKA
jgi:hypothetical protein